MWNKYKVHTRDTYRNETFNRGGLVEPIDIAGANALRRAEIGISKEDLAYRTGLSPATITNIKKMDLSPSIKVLM